MGGEAGLDLDSDAEALINAMLVQPNTARKLAINDTVIALKAAGVWTKIDALWVMAAHDEQAGRLNWKSPGNFTLVAVNLTGFATDSGFYGSGSDYLDTEWIPATHGVNYTLNDASIGTYSPSNMDGLYADAGVRDASSRITYLYPNSGGNQLLRINQTGGGTSVAVANSVGLHVNRRTASNAISALKNGVVIGTASTVSVALPTSKIFLLAENNNGTVLNPSPRTLSMAFVGAAMSEAEQASLYSIFVGYLAEMTPVGPIFPAWTLPSGREDSSGICYPSGGRLYVFGGDDAGPGGLIQIVKVDMAAGVVTILPSVALPSGRYKAPTVWDSVNNLAYIYGGLSEGTAFATVIRFNPATDVLTTLAAVLPSASAEFGAAFDSDQEVVYLFGGFTGLNSSTLLTRILKHNPGAATLTTLAAVLPVALASQAAAYVPDQQAIYLFGGFKNSTESPRTVNTIYKFDCVTETISALAATLPAIRDSATAVYSPTQDRIYIFGGYSNAGSGGGTYYDSILEFNPNTETIATLTSTLPKGTDDFQAGYDSVNDVIYLMATLPAGAADNDHIHQKYICRFTPPDNGVVQLG